MSSNSEPPPRHSGLRVKVPASLRHGGRLSPPASGASPERISGEPDDPATAAADGYEAKYMDGGRSLARSKKPMPWWFHAALGTALLAVVASAVGTGQLAVLATAPLLLLTWLLFTHLRVTVTADKVHVQLGLFGPAIPLERIESARAERYNPVKYGGWGIRFGVDGSTAYSLPGGSGMAVRIEYRTARGARRAVVVSSNEAEYLAATIERARAARAGVRVETTAADTTAAGDARDEPGAARARDERDRNSR